MINFKQIYEGYKNLIIPSADMKVAISQVRQERLNQCFDCPFHSKFHKTPLRPDDHCTECGCNLDAKTSCLTCECPKQKWLAVVSTIEEEEELKKQTI